MAKEKKLKKLAYAKQWSTSKRICNQYMIKQLKTDKKDAKGDKEEMNNVATNAKNWKSLYSDFNMGLTPTMKALENAKTADEQVKHGTSVLKILGLYEKRIKKFEKSCPDGIVPDIRNTSVSLKGMLNRIQKDLKKAIK